MTAKRSIQRYSRQHRIGYQFTQGHLWLCGLCKRQLAAPAFHRGRLVDMSVRLRDTVAYRECKRKLPVEQSQYSEIQRRIRHVAKCLYMRARALIIVAIYNALVSAGAVKWQDKDRFDSCCTRNQPRHSIIVFIASQIPYNEIHFLTTSICTVIAA